MRRGPYSNHDDGVKEAAFEDHVRMCDPLALSGVLKLSSSEKRLAIAAWWRLALVREPYLANLLRPDFDELKLAVEMLHPLAGMEPTIIESPIFNQGEPVSPSFPASRPLQFVDVTGGRSPTKDNAGFDGQYEIGYAARSLVKRARLACARRIKLRRYNPGMVFNYETDAAEYLRRLLPCDQPSVAELQKAFRLLGQEQYGPRHETSSALRKEEADSAAEDEAVASGRKNRYGGSDVLDTRSAHSQWAASQRRRRRQSVTDVTYREAV